MEVDARSTKKLCWKTLELLLISVQSPVDLRFPFSHEVSFRDVDLGLQTLLRILKPLD